MQDRMKVCSKRIACRGSLLLLAFLFAVSFTLARAQTCTINSTTLVNSCGPWLGAYAYDYTEEPQNVIDQLVYHEQRVNYNMAISHAYNSLSLDNAGGLTSDEQTLAGGTSGDAKYLLMDWILTDANHTWHDGTGPGTTGCGDTQACQDITADVASMAAAISKIPNKVFVALGDEPQNKVSSDSCTTIPQGANSGSPTDYIAMWKYVTGYFASHNVTNVVWVMIYMSDQNYSCLIPKLWPGSQHVNWLAAYMYDFGNGWHNSKGNGIADELYPELWALPGAPDIPWMVSEFGSKDDYGDKENEDFYAQIGTGVDDGTFPKFKAYLVFDAKCVQIDYSGTCRPGDLSVDTTKQGDYITDIAGDTNFQKLSVY